jgi:DNA-binding transcriptional LysR family regulator|tara:strand:- start:3184 stop:4095 length:912 start_codon:yes stop_codon:yes gene_type:complete
VFLRQFQYLVALEQEQHFGRAAEKCHVSQPSLSSAIKSLEKELGIPLILRKQKFEGFTEEGKRVVTWAKRLLADRSAMVEELSIMRSDLNGRLRIGATPFSSPLFPTVSQLFQKRYPSVQLDIQFIGTDRLLQGLTNFEIDIGVTDLDNPALDPFVTMELYEEPLYLLLPDNDWLDDSPTISWSDACKLPLCLLSKSMRERQIMDEAFEQAGVRCKPILESNSIFQLAFHAMAGDLATIVPKRFAHLPNTKQKLLESPTVSQTLGLVWVHGNPVLPMTKATSALMREALDAGAFENFSFVGTE